MNEQVRDESNNGKIWAYGEIPRFPFPSKEVMKELKLKGEDWFQICERYQNIKCDYQWNKYTHFSDLKNPPEGVRIFTGRVNYGDGWKDGPRMDISGRITRAIVRCLYRQMAIGQDDEDERKRIPYKGPNAVRVFEPTAFSGDVLNMQATMTLEGLRERCRKTDTYAGIDFEYSESIVKVKNKDGKECVGPEWCQAVVVKKTTSGHVKFRGPRIFFSNFLQSASAAVHNYPDQMLCNVAERNALKKAYTGFDEPDLGYDADAGATDIVGQALGSDVLDPRTPGKHVPDAPEQENAEEQAEVPAQSQGSEQELIPESFEDPDTGAISKRDDLPFMGGDEAPAADPVAEGPPQQPKAEDSQASLTESGWDFMS